MGREEMDKERKGEAPAREAIHISEREAALIEAIRGGGDPAALLELATKEIISRLPPERGE